MELDGYDLARLLELDALIDPREWRLEAIDGGQHRITRVVDGEASRVWGNSDAFHRSLLKFLRANGVTDT